WGFRGRLGADAGSSARVVRAWWAALARLGAELLQRSQWATPQPSAATTWFGLAPGLSRSCLALRRRRPGDCTLHRRQPAACQAGGAYRRLSLVGCGVVVKVGPSVGRYGSLAE